MKKMIIALAVGAAAVSTPIMAQAPGGGHRGWGGGDQTREEAKQRADMIFQMIDSNRDGVVTREEAEQAVAQFQASRGNSEGGSRGGGMMQRMIDQMFASSPSLTLQQFEAQALARFDAQDLNHDGTVTAEERRQARERAGAVSGTPTLPPAPGAVPAPPPPQ
ncbi:MAG TPA: hypothetical protein VJ846_07915 [Sphingomicrobium sp.]|nr:hypothetical protein [Sphingomicrobium sp.]